MPDGLKIIGDYAFKNNKKLTRITLPDNLKSIGNDAFSGMLSFSTFILSEETFNTFVDSDVSAVQQFIEGKMGISFEDTQHYCVIF